MDVIALKEFVPLRILVSITLSVAILMTPRWWLLLWVPLLPYSGIIFYSPNNPRELMHISSYVELIICLSFIYYFFKTQKDLLSILLFGIVITSLPSFLNSGNHFFISSFLFLCLLSGAGMYLYFRENVPHIADSKIIDIAVITWVVLGILIKIYIGIRLNEPWFVQRGGGILGSNHAAGILFLLLPLVRNRMVAILALMFLFFQFSRGIYLAIALYFMLWMAFINSRQSIRWILYLAIAGFLFIGILGNISFISEYGPVTINDFVLSRFKTFAGINAQDFMKGVLADSRWELYQLALIFSQQVSFTGIGLGGFSWALQDSHFPFLYTNAHNMYLTLLTEGGFLFISCFIILLIYLLTTAFKINKPVFVGLLTWTFYGLYSGEIYETGGMATAGDYYNFIFIISYLSYQNTRNQIFRIQSE